MQIALWCVMLAVVLAPLATVMQMIEIDVSVAEVSDEAVMPCHGAAGAKDGAPTSSTQAKMASCTCTPWCHAALLGAIEFMISDAGIQLPMPITRDVALKTADTAPLFKPPIIELS